MSHADEMPMLYLGAAGVVIVAAFVASRGSGAQNATTPGADPKLYAAQVQGYQAAVSADVQRSQLGVDTVLKYQAARDSSDATKANLQFEREKTTSDAAYQNKVLESQNQQAQAQQAKDSQGGFFGFILDVAKIVIPFFV